MIIRGPSRRVSPFEPLSNLPANGSSRQKLAYKIWSAKISGADRFRRDGVLGI